MKYSPEMLKSYGITYHIYQDDMTDNFKKRKINKA